MLLSDIKEGAQARKRKKSKDKAAPDPAKKTKKAATPEHDRRTRTGTRDRGPRESRKPEHPRDLYRNISAGTSAKIGISHWAYLSRIATGRLALCQVAASALIRR